MYKLIERDGRVFGPVDLPTLRQWVREGRVTPRTRIEDAETGVRMPANRLRGLQDAFDELPPSGAEPHVAPEPPSRQRTLIHRVVALALAAAAAWGLWLLLRPHLSRTTYTPHRPDAATAGKR